MAGRAERRARRLLAAYPWRVRAEQGDEVVGTVLDALPPTAERLPKRDQLDLVRGGVRMRRQRRPPWPTVLAYSLGSRIHPRWIRWVFDDLEHPRYARNKRIRLLVAWPLVMGPLAWLFRDPLVLLYGSGGFVGGMFGIERERQRRRERHGLLPGGSDPSQVWVQRRRGSVLPDVPVARLLLAVGGPGVAMAVAGLVAVIDDPAPDGGVVPSTADVVATVRPWSVVGVVVGGALAASGLRRVRRARRAGPGAPISRRARRVTSVVAGLTGLALAYEAAFMAVSLASEPAEVLFAGLAVVLGPPALAVTAVGLALVVLGRRWRTPVGLWAVVPALGPRQQVEPMARQWAEQREGVELWTAEGDRTPGGGTRRGEYRGGPGAEPPPSSNRGGPLCTRPSRVP